MNSGSWKKESRKKKTSIVGEEWDAKNAGRKEKGERRGSEKKNERGEESELCWGVPW